MSRRIRTTLPALLLMLAAVAARAEPPRLLIVDAPLRDVGGRPVGFARDVIGDAIVVINPIWTGCSTLCPLTSAIMGEVGERLGSRLGERVRLVSLAIDPLELPAAQLRAWVEAYGAVPGWLWVGGDPRSTDLVLAGLRAQPSGSITDHPPVFLVVDGRDGRTRRFDGLADAGVLLAAIDQLEQSR